MSHLRTNRSRVLLFANNRAEAERFAAQYALSNWLYVSNIQQIQGMLPTYHAIVGGIDHLNNDAFKLYLFYQSVIERKCKLEQTQQLTPS